MAELVRIHGLKELKREMAQLEPRLQKNILRGAVTKVAAEIRDDARSRVPKNTGNLRKNIVSKRMRGSRHHIKAAVIVREEGKRGEKRNAFYWRFLEYGTVFINARPFLRPAYDAMKGKIDRVMVTFIRGRFDLAVKR